MLGTVIVFCAGLLIGWNLLPQPAWVKALWDKVVAKFKTMGEKQIKDGGCCGPK